MKYAVALIIAGLVFMYWGRSGRAAEADRPHAIWLFTKPLANEPPDQPRIFIISQEYATKDDCLLVLRRVRIMAPNAKAKCLPKED